MCYYPIILMKHVVRKACGLGETMVKGSRLFPDIYYWSRLKDSLTKP